MHTSMHTSLYACTRAHTHVNTNAGFQRSISSLWQQAGRAGRRNHKSLSIYVAWDSPIDQYFMRHPTLLMGMPVEACVLNLSNRDILAPHLLCAASELPLTTGDGRLFGDAPPANVPHAPAAVAPPLSSGHDGGQHGGGGGGALACAAGDAASPCAGFGREVSALVHEGHAALGCLEPLAPVAPGGSPRWAHCGGAKPQRVLSLRAIDDKRWQLLVPNLVGELQAVEEVGWRCRWLDGCDLRCLSRADCLWHMGSDLPHMRPTQVEEWMAFYQLYEGATYMNNGRTYLVHTLDFDNRVATARLLREAPQLL